MTARKETINLIARQIALSEQRIFAKLDPKNLTRLETMAEGIVATVERKMRAQGNGMALALKANWEPR